MLCVLILAMAFLALPLFAQDPPPPPPAEDQVQPPKVTEEMVVTARKREETVQDVPISVSAPSEQKLRDVGAETIEDVAANVAGFTVQNLGPGQSQVAMRGVSAGQIVRDQPGVKEQVGVYLDESAISMSLFTPDIDLFDLSRIEVLRGPQGTLFGSGSLSGTVRYITNQPKLGISETDRRADAQHDRRRRRRRQRQGRRERADRRDAPPCAWPRTTRSTAASSTPCSPTSRVNEDVNSGDRAGARLSFLFQPNDKLSVTPRLLYQEVDMDGWNRIDAFNILANPFTTTRPKVTLGDRQQFTQIDEPFTDEFLLGDLNLTYDISDALTLTSVTSYTDRDVLVVRDATALTGSITGGSFGAPASIFTIDAPLFDATQAKGFTQELRLSGERGPLQWVAGVFYTDSERDYQQNLQVFGFEDGCKVVSCGPLSGVPTAGTKLANKDELYKSDLHYDYTQKAIFGEATWTVSERFDLTGGLRFYDFEEDRTQVFDGIFSDPERQRRHASAPTASRRASSPAIKLNDNTRLNGQISKGFRLGGINDPLNLPLCTPADLATFDGRQNWEDETLWNYEVGSKSTIMGGRGTFNASVFRADIEDLQATVTAGSCSSRVVFNVPKARSSGAEIEFEIAPNDNFDFAISRQQDQLRAEIHAHAPPAASWPASRTGNRLPTVPEFQMAAAATYHWRMNTLAGYVTGAFQHIGSRYTQIGDQAAGFGTVNLNSFGTPGIGGPFTQSTFTFNPKLPAYDILNLRFGVLQAATGTRRSSSTTSPTRRR